LCATLFALAVGRYRHCPNLTIIDTPGFILKVWHTMDATRASTFAALLVYTVMMRSTVHSNMIHPYSPKHAPLLRLQARNGEPDNTPDEIMNMVKQQAAPPHRCVKQMLSW
jgi:hypothetical protein